MNIRPFTLIVLVCAFSAVLAKTTTPALAQASAASKEREQQIADLKATQEFLEDSLAKLKSGKYIYTADPTEDAAALFAPIPRSAYIGWLVAQLMTGRLSDIKVATAMRNLGRFQKVAIEAYEEQLKEVKEAIRKAGGVLKPPRPGIHLVLEQSVTDRKGAGNPDMWDVDKEAGTATYTPPYGKAEYTFKLPDFIDLDGVKIHFGIKVTAKKGSRFAPSMSMVGDIDMSPGNPFVYPLAESEETKEEYKDYTLTPRMYSSETKFVTLTVRLQDGLSIAYRYRVEY